MSGHDLIVIGGGLIGSAIGWGAARAGADVTLLDEGDVAFRAARGNFGLIWLQGKGVGTPRYMHWSLRAARMWPRFASTLQAQTGIDIGWRPSGGLHFCLSEAELQGRRDMIARTRAAGGDIDIEMLDRSALAEMLPGLGPDVLGASFSPLDSHVSPLYLLRALQKGLQLAGGSYRPNFRIDEIICRPNGFIVLSEGRRIEGRRLVIAAGLGAAKLAPQVGLSMPVAPERGQIVVTERLKPFFPYAGNCLRQSAEGSVLLGSSHEEAGFDDGTDVRAGAKLSHLAVRIFPRLAEASVVRLWGSLRVMTPDGLPIYEESQRCPGAFAATCHSGVTLASIHALEVGPGIAAGALPAEAGFFCSTRLTQPA
ncbi:FAD dependent oxidoreductase family protein [Paraburkholderia xenovorans LB400]|uniref:Glycine oxidase n=1 Tax=Paraburkholderia xenovorans (strain LB400) TaxID=266265 RepID=Q13FV5_PARXL|nr:FAD-dependent oxidoreductase [Paraburkholderia xenovorans]ABE37034.1 glycine oxidase [Paraburkholderia xenovorans LB400]AIP35042.1 FAD dependent oxidoreductase family protein [Paraburkholderia xenovorans LB400]